MGDESSSRESCQDVVQIPKGKLHLPVAKAREVVRDRLSLLPQDLQMDKTWISRKGI